jgi:predicted NBD/HSP70 family sugar kinase
MLNYARLQSEAAQGKDHVFQTVDRTLKQLMARHPAIAGIGISHSGVIDQQGGRVLFWPQLAGWKDVPIKQIFEERYGLPTFVEDAVRAMATMEQRLGLAKDVRNFVFINVAVGIGSAIFVDRSLYTGRDGLAGEVEHTTVEKDGALCSCGNRGCLELYSSASAIIARVRAELQHGVSSTLANDVDGPSVEKIVAAADSQDRLAQRVLSEAGACLGIAVASVVNLLNPERIILAGAVLHSDQGIVFNSFLYNLRDRAYPQATEHLDVVLSPLGEEAAAVGATLIAGAEVLKEHCRDMERTASRPPLADESRI